MLALLLVAQVAAWQAVATCRVTDDPRQRVWSLERLASSTPEGWRITFSSRDLDKPRVELPLPRAAPLVDQSRIALFYSSANGGRRIDWTIEDGPSSLDLHVNHGLEVNVERDLDPAVELMNTDGRLAIRCAIGQPAASDRRGTLERSPEWTVATGFAWSVRLFESTSGRRYAVQTGGYARELTGDLRLVGIPGRFAWGAEAMPLFAQFSPSTIYGIGFSPIVWRWNFPPRTTWSAFAELAMGGMWTTEPIPEGTSRGNFTAHWGGGVRLRPRGAHALLVAYRFQHFSNGNQLGSNPGVNSHVVLAGWTRRDR
jgi:Lipid A 3-O-deacylase (PagL)